MKEIETDNNVGGKTPEEIKKSLKRCGKDRNCHKFCSYWDIEDCTGELFKDALAYIEQLERERDAALADLKGLGCTYCKRLESPDESMCFDKCVDNCNWEWQGVKEEKNENT